MSDLAEIAGAMALLSRPSSLDNGLAREADDLGIVAIGASAGGLEACTTLVEALPRAHGLALILVQHLEPTHASMMVDLLAGHTSTTVLQAAEGMRLRPGHLYVIPPSLYLSVAGNVLHLSAPTVQQGLRLPFDFLLQSLAKGSGRRIACVVLSGTGADGSIGIQEIKASGGLVVAQEPSEAGHDGMPRHAIETGAVDHVLPAAQIPDLLVMHDRHRRTVSGDDSGTVSKSAAEAGDRSHAPPEAAQREHAPPEAAQRDLVSIIEILQAKTTQDFSQYKHGTLKRQVERRMAMAAIAPDEIDRYLLLLASDAHEVDLLAKDLLIRVTSFFRDRKVFDLLDRTVIPDLVRNHPADLPLRIWVAGCSTGEETYSLAMLFQEHIAAANRPIRLQLFASDLDADAVTRAREGLYPKTIESAVSPERLARFFSKETHGYLASPELRASIVFAVQDVLGDPPFARLDFVSCRNVLIYLLPDAQARVLSLLHFALRQGGLLLLGNAETPGNIKSRFEVVSKSERIYRRIGRSKPGLRLSPDVASGAPYRSAARGARLPPRQSELAQLSRQLVLDAYTPAAILINRAGECLFSLGPIDRYLRMASGHPTIDVLATARSGLRTPLRSAIGQATARNERVVVAGRMNQNGQQVSFNVDVQPVIENDEPLFLVCFVEVAANPSQPVQATGGNAGLHVAELERKLETTRIELEDAVRDLDLSAEKHKAINDEALSINEEYQSTNEELMASKEELQSLNEELTALNSQLQETLERQRTTSDDLQNVLYSTNIATLFLDRELRIRFFTPATRLLFSVIPGDIGRPLADLKSRAADDLLEADANMVLNGHPALEQEIETRDGQWFRRHILPYLTHDGRVEGVVITFNDITTRKNTSKALEVAKKEAELANLAKSRFLAAASHDLRQPLQTLSLLQGLLAKNVHGDRAQGLVARVDETLSATSAMLDTLLDINQIEVGVVRAHVAGFEIDTLLDRMRQEFNYHAQAKGLGFHVVSCGLSVMSDARLLEQMIRNLIANALKYTEHGKVLLGCRRRGAMLSLQVWDSGAGIPETEVDAIFEEYHQLDNPARERSRGLGLGLSIVQRLGTLLDHRVAVRSQIGKGSVFTIEVPLLPDRPDAGDMRQRRAKAGAGVEPIRHGMILVVEDDPDVLELIGLLLETQGYEVTLAGAGATALARVAAGEIVPDLLLADYNLPGDLNGVQLAARLRAGGDRDIPVIILTGDISAQTAGQIAAAGYLQLSKPVKQQELLRAIQQQLIGAASTPRPASGPVARNGHDSGRSTIFVVDDDHQVGEAIRAVLEQDGHAVETFITGEALLDAYSAGGQGCILIDAYLPGISGIELLHRLRDAGHDLPAIMITGSSDVPMAVEAMKAGAMDFIEKPVGRVELLAVVGRALEQSRDAGKLSAWRETAASQISTLTPRQHEIMTMVLAGHPNKNIAADLNISQRTVENHRAAIMKKTGAASVPALTRLVLAANWSAGDRASVAAVE